jgi:hypothetical protein
MGWRDILVVGTEELVQRALRGELTAGQLWTALKGAERYRRAMADGDVAAEAEALRRARICAACPSRSSEEKRAVNATAHYCGEAFVARLSPPEPTCGCLVGLTVNGETTAAGKVYVLSEQCPQGKWRHSPSISLNAASFSASPTSSTQEPDSQSAALNSSTENTADVGSSTPSE